MFENVRLDTQRPGYVPCAPMPTTTVPDTYLPGVVANLRPVTQRDYNGLPAAALRADYILTLVPALNVGKTDIGVGDRLVNIVRLDTGLPYDDSVPAPGQTTAADVFWEVQYAPPTRMGPLEHRVVYVLRDAGSGPGHR